MIKKSIHTFLFLLLLHPLFSQYCTPVVSSNGSVAIGDSIGIVNVTLNTINNNSAAKMGYENFTGISTNLTKGRQYNLIVSGGYSDQDAGAWIDFNQNNVMEGVFTTGNDLIAATFGGFPAFTPTTISTFTVPLTAKSGNTRMRVSSNEQGFLCLMAENCSDILTGDVEEYTVNMVDTFYINVYQNIGSCINPGSIDQNILLVEVISTDSNNTFNATTFDFNTIGCTNAAGDIINAKLWFTDTVRSFNCANKILYGTANNPNGTFIISGNQALVLGGKSSYFWLTYDISPTAAISNIIDAECTGAIINSANYNTPTPTAIAGNRVISNSSSYQNREANIWYFSQGYGIDFNCSPPSPISDPNPAFAPSEGSATMCDKNGNLLFYTDGSRVFDRCHNQMPNGFGLLGTGSSMHGALIIPRPGNPNRYYIFTTDQGQSDIGPTIDPNKGSRLLVNDIDMTLNGGRGDIVSSTKNDTLMLHITNEAITAVLHCNKKDIWVLVGEYATYNFHAFLITSAGIQAPIVSNVPWGIIEMHIKSTIKFSPNGRMLVMHPLFRSSPCCSQGRPVLFDFDNSTGIVSNARVLQAQDGAGASFSNDNTKLYLGSLNNQLYQYDLCTLPLTRIAVGTGPSAQWLMQNAPDGKIYTNHTSNDFVGVINNPNSAGAASNYVASGFLVPGLSTSTGAWSNMNSAFLESYFNTSVFSSANSGFTATTACFGDSTSFTDTSSVLPGTCSSTILPRTWKWYFGDPLTGNADTSFLQNPKHLYSSSGTFTVTQIIEEGCETDTITKIITVDPTPIATLSGTDSICLGTTSSLNASGGTTYYWNTGNTNSSINITPTGNSVYSVTASIGNCTDSASFTVYTLPVPTAGITSSATTICTGDSLSLTASGGNAYYWNTGNTNISITIAPTGNTTYSLIAAIGNCFDTTNVSITVNNTPVANAGVDDSICEGNTSVLNASGGSSYSWSMGSTNSSISVSPSSTSSYTLIAFNGICSDTDVVTVTVNYAPIVNAGNNITVIHGESAVLSASGGTTYLWTPANNLSCTNCANPTVTPTQTTTYYVTVTDSNGCTSMDSIIVTIDFRCGFYIPNAFSPNNDGQNDLFLIQSNCITFLNLKIYDRWGEKLFETFDQSVGWDGTYKGERMNTDVFVYKAIVNLLNGEEIIQSGNISLIR